MFDNQKDPILSEVKLSIVNKWIVSQTKSNVAFSTIKRRVASLSSLFQFYKDIGVIHSNPFKAVDIPEGAVGFHSVELDYYQLEDVYQCL
jgi:site-specific recombinase XerD